VAGSFIHLISTGITVRAQRFLAFDSLRLRAPAARSYATPTHAVCCDSYTALPAPVAVTSLAVSHISPFVGCSAVLAFNSHAVPLRYGGGCYTRCPRYQTRAVTLGCAPLGCSPDSSPTFAVAPGYLHAFRGYATYATLPAFTFRCLPSKPSSAFYLCFISACLPALPRTRDTTATGTLLPLGPYAALHGIRTFCRTHTFCSTASHLPPLPAPHCAAARALYTDAGPAGCFRTTRVRLRAATCTTLPLPPNYTRTHAAYS